MLHEFVLINAKNHYTRITTSNFVSLKGLESGFEEKL